MEFHKEEKWAFIPDTDLLYKISSEGRIFSVKRNMILRQFINHKGYYLCQIHVHTEIKTFIVHRLVAKAFIPNPENKPQVNHKDGNKIHNCIINLEWHTAKENMQHAYSNNIKNNRGSNNPFSKLTVENVLAIREYFKTDKSANLKDASQKFKVSVSHICGIKNKKSWTHI